MYKNNTSVLIKKWEKPVWSVSKNLTICSLMIVFWANVMNEQWQINNLISRKIFYSKTDKLILRSNSRNTNWIVDPFTQVKSAGHMAKNHYNIARVLALYKSHWFSSPEPLGLLSRYEQIFIYARPCV